VDENDYAAAPRIVIGTLGTHALTYLIELDRSSCVICTDEYDACDMVAVPPCKHVVHHLCMRQHLQTNTSQRDPSPCPVCRASLLHVKPDWRVVAIDDVLRPGAERRRSMPAARASQQLEDSETQHRHIEEAMAAEAIADAQDEADEANRNESQQQQEREHALDQWRSERLEQEREYAELICHEHAYSTLTPRTPVVSVPLPPTLTNISPHSVRILRCARFESVATQSPACKRSLLPTAPQATPTLAVRVAVEVAVAMPAREAAPAPAPTATATQAAPAASTALPAAAPAPTPTATQAAPAASTALPAAAPAPGSDSEGEIDAGDLTGAEETGSDTDDPPGNDQYSVEHIQQRRIEPHSGMYEYYVKWYHH
jgi:hypothetical protein